MSSPRSVPTGVQIHVLLSQHHTGKHIWDNHHRSPTQDHGTSGGATHTTNNMAVRQQDKPKVVLGADNDDWKVV